MTADKGFADIRKYEIGNHHGIILIRLDEENRRNYLNLVEIVLDSIDLESLSGAIIVVTPRGIRIRKP